MHSGNGHHIETATTDANNAWAEYVNGLVRQSTMDVLRAAADEFVKIIADVNGDLDKSIDVFDAKMKAAIATCERAAAEIRCNVPAMIERAWSRRAARQAGDREGSRREPGLLRT
jgi:hypothetical protein